MCCFWQKDATGTEASGNINFRNIKRVSKTNVDRISIGNLTHSAKSYRLYT